MMDDAEWERTLQTVRNLVAEKGRLGAEVDRLQSENTRLRDALELIETTVVDGRANLDVWDLSEIATKALKGE